MLVLCKECPRSLSVSNLEAVLNYSPCTSGCTAATEDFEHDVEKIARSRAVDESQGAMTPKVPHDIRLLSTYRHRCPDAELPPCTKVLAHSRNRLNFCTVCRACKRP